MNVRRVPHQQLPRNQPPQGEHEMDALNAAIPPSTDGHTAPTDTEAARVEKANKEVEKTKKNELVSDKLLIQPGKNA